MMFTTLRQVKVICKHLEKMKRKRGTNMKRILTLVMSLLLVLTLIPFSAVSAMAVEGDGETTSAASSATYVDVADYTAFMAQITDGKISKSIRLTGDIVFPENTVIEAEIATLANGVVIDGNGHSMTGFTHGKSPVPP